MENLTNWCVYMHEHRANGKRYIGATSQKPTNRWQNGNGYQRCPVFFAAIQADGWDSFKHEILYTGLTKEEAASLETELIAKYQTQDPEKGYNMADGGEVNRGFHRTDEFKQKVSAARSGVYAGENHNMYGVPRTAATKEKIRAAQEGKPKPAETCKKMSVSATKRWGPDNIAEREHLREMNKGGNNPKARPVLCVETGEEYEAARSAAEAVGIDASCIIRCCNRQRKTAGGYHWKYIDKAAVAGD